MAYDQIDYEVIGPVARLWHARPTSRNAQSTRLLDELDDALQRAIDDAKVRVIILGGRGDHFSSGHDLRDEDMLSRHHNPEDRYDYENERYLRYCLKLWDAPKPVIAQVQGACIAGGFMVANMCDLVIAADDAFFSDPVLNALNVSAVEVLVHPWVLGLRKAKQMLFTGSRIGAAEALSLGMVNEVVPRADLENAALAMAEAIARADPFALRLTKRALNRTADIQGFRNALDAHFDTHQLSHMSTAFQRHSAAGLDRGVGLVKSRSA